MLLKMPLPSQIQLQTIPYIIQYQSTMGDALLTYWYLFSLSLNTSLMIYLPYTFFFFEALPPIQDPEIISSAIILALQVAEIMVKLQTETFGAKQVDQKFISQKIYMHKGVSLDVLGIIAVASTFVNTATATPFRLLIYCKIPSVALYDKHIYTTIKSSGIEFFYTLMKIMFIYLTFCNLTAGAFFKLDYHIYASQGFYFQNGMVWLVSAASMPNIIDWNYTIHYLYSMYWSIITACTIGYGDITPLNPYEVVLVCIIFVPNILFYGYLIDNVNLKFSKLQEIDEKVLESQLAILKTLSAMNTDFADIRFFRYQIKRVLENEMDEKATVYNPLSRTLKMELNYEVFKKPLSKIGELSLEDSYILCSLIQEVVYQNTEVIDSANKFVYVLEGRGNVVLSGLDVCSHESSSSVLSQYRPERTLNTYNFLSQVENPFIRYVPTERTRVYEIKEWANTLSLREKKMQVLVCKRYAEFGIECQVCNSTKHPTDQCLYLIFDRTNIRENLGQANKDLGYKKSFPYNGREMLRRHDRQNQTVRNIPPFTIAKFEESYVKKSNDIRL